MCLGALFRQLHWRFVINPCTDSQKVCSGLVRLRVKAPEMAGTSPRGGHASRGDSSDQTVTRVGPASLIAKHTAQRARTDCL